MLIKKTPSPSRGLQNASRVIAAVRELEEKGAIKYSNGIASLDVGLWKDKKTALTWIENLYIVFTVTKRHRKRQSLYFRDLDTDALIGLYTNEKANCMINF